MRCTKLTRCLYTLQAPIRQGAATGGRVGRGVRGPGSPSVPQDRLPEDIKLVIGEDTEDEEEGAA